MIRFLVDENFDNDIVVGLKRRSPTVDLVWVQEVGLRRTDDRLILAWAAREDRLLLTHDVSTMVPFAYERVAAGEEMAGVLAVAALLPIGQVIEDLYFIAECSLEGEWRGRVVFLPLK